MKISIRRGVFETNSSSVHTLALTKTDSIDTCIGLADQEVINYIEENGIIISDNPLNNFEAKVSAIFYCLLGKCYDEFYICRGVDYRSDLNMFLRYLSILANKLGVDIKIHPQSKESDWGYLDHKSFEKFEDSVVNENTVDILQYSSKEFEKLCLNYSSFILLDSEIDEVDDYLFDYDEESNKLGDGKILLSRHE